MGGGGGGEEGSEAAVGEVPGCLGLPLAHCHLYCILLAEASHKASYIINVSVLLQLCIVNSLDTWRIRSWGH